MKRRINYSIKDQEGGTRFLDYTNILNEKENQIVELEKKINNLEERLRRVGQRETELENRIIALTADIRRKDDIIRFKNDQLHGGVFFDFR
jgi:chromosome segregation ATPase